MKLLKWAVVVVVLFAVVSTIIGKGSNPKPEGMPAPKIETKAPNDQDAIRVSKDFYNRGNIKARIKRANPDCTGWTLGDYKARSYPSTTGGWIVDFYNDGESQWTMVVVCENNTWGLARCVVKGKKIYEDEDIHFDKSSVWHLK